MGARQSKRSVDITTGKEVIAEGGEVAASGGEGKLERIEDLDALKPQLNGDAAHQEIEISDKEKKMQDLDEAPENEKDTNNEKEIILSPVTVNGGSGDTEENGKEGDEVAPETPEPENNKKPKKEKVKKKWSFRSISFSRKDKQKPTKKEETNGDCDKVPEEGADAVPAVVAVEAADLKAEIQNAEKEVVKAVESEKIAEKTPETPVTEPLTNGSGTPDSPVEEIKMNGDAASVEDVPVAVPQVQSEPAPVEPAEAPVVPVASEVESLPMNGLKIEEPAVEEAAPEVASAPAPPVEVAAPAPAPEPVDDKSPVIAEAEVCVAKESPVSEMAPPPLPSTPAPSSLTMFAESTMASPLAEAAPAQVESVASPSSPAPVEPVCEKVASDPQTASAPVPTPEILPSVTPTSDAPTTDAPASDTPATTQPDGQSNTPAPIVESESPVDLAVVSSESVPPPVAELPEPFIAVCPAMPDPPAESMPSPVVENIEAPISASIVDMPPPPAPESESASPTAETAPSPVAVPDSPISEKAQSDASEGAVAEPPSDSFPPPPPPESCADSVTEGSVSESLPPPLSDALLNSPTSEMADSPSKEPPVSSEEPARKQSVDLEALAASATLPEVSIPPPAEMASQTAPTTVAEPAELAAALVTPQPQVQAMSEVTEKSSEVTEAAATESPSVDAVTE